MICLGAIITFVIPMVWCMILQDPFTFTKICAWEQKHHSLSVWTMRFCLIGGSLIMAIGGMKKYGWIGVLLPASIWGSLLLLAGIEYIVAKKKRRKE